MIKYTTFIFNIDGFVWNWKEVDKAFLDVYKYLVEHNRRVIFLTNNSAYSKLHLTRKLQEKGLDELEEDDVFSSTDALTHFLYKHSIKSIYLIGEYGLLKDLENAGIEISKHADYVVVGIDRNLSYAKLKEAYNILKRENTYLLHLDNAVIWQIGVEQYPITLPVISYLETAVGKKLNKIFVGKPSATFKEALLKRYSLFSSSSILISNKPNDIIFASQLGIDAMLVHESYGDIVRKLSPSEKPKHVSTSIYEVKNLL